MPSTGAECTHDDVEDLHCDDGESYLVELFDL